MQRRFKVELFEQIRRDYEFGGVKIRELARKFGVHRRDIRQAISSALPPARKLPARHSPKLQPVRAFIDAILESDQQAPRKQRHTAHRIYIFEFYQLSSKKQPDFAMLVGCLSLTLHRST
jgi:transposase-like protein